MIGPQPSAPNRAARLASLVSRAVSSRATVVIGIIARVGFRVAARGDGKSGDFDRYMGFATSLMRGEGYQWPAGQFDTSLAPGYPVFLAFVRSMHDSAGAIIGAQIALGVASMLLLYFAVLPKGRARAGWALVVMGLYPWIITSSVVVLSEVLTVFFASLVAFAASRIISVGPSTTSAALLCVSAAGAAMTAPHMLLLAAGTVAWCIWRLRAHRRELAVALLSGLAVVLPWQVHCYVAQGFVNPGLYNPQRYAFQRSGYATWVRTWAVTTHDVRLGIFNLHKFDEYPDRAFESAEQREQLRAIALRYGKYPDHMTPEHHEAFRASAERRRAEHPMTTQVLIPAARAVVLWVEVDPAGKFSPSQLRSLTPGRMAQFYAEFGAAKAVSQLMKSVVSLGFLVLHLAVVAVFGSYLIRAVLARQSFPAVVALALLAYTFGSALVVLPETRRTVTMIPLLVFMLFFAPSRPEQAAPLVAAAETP
jgi:hypothetical protein